MQASNKTVWLVAALVVLFLLSFHATSSWRTERGLTFSALRSPSAQARRDLSQYDAKLKPVVEQSEKLRAQLQKSEALEREVGQSVTASLRRLDASKRAELRVQFESGALSAANQANPEIATLYAQYREAAALRRHTSALRTSLAKYESELTRAFAERDRLEKRVETIEATGYDPEQELSLGKDENAALLDELTATTDAMRPETRDDALDIEDVLGADDANAFADRFFGDRQDHQSGSEGSLFDETAAGEYGSDANAALGGASGEWSLSERIEQYKAQTDPGAKPNKGRFSPGALLKGNKTTLCLLAAGGFFLTFMVILTLGLVGIFALTKKPAPNAVVVAPGQTQVVVQQGVSTGRVVFIVASTLFWTCVGGPIGGVFGLLLGLLLSSWRSFIRLLGAIGFIIVASVVALLFFAGVCILAIF